MSSEDSTSPKDSPGQPFVANGGTFVGARDPKWTLDHEHAWHNAAAYLFADGKSYKYVATVMGKSQPAVQNLFRQPWFQKKISAILSQEGHGNRGKDVSKLIAGEQYNSVSTVTSLRDDPEVPAAIRLAAARDMLDRGQGKPTQRVEMAHEAVSDDPVAEVARLEEENNRMRGQL